MYVSKDGISQNSDGRHMRNEILVLENLKKYYYLKVGAFSEPAVLKAVDGVSLSVHKGEILGLVGESGCGKSTVGRCILALEVPTEGSISFNGTQLNSLKKKALKSMRRECQIIFQDPFASLNPKKRIRDIVGEPLIIHKVCKGKELDERVVHLLTMVGLHPDYMNRYPHQFSGGQRQRIGIARAIALEPKFIVADEPISALDISIQSQIINLMLELQERFNFTYLFIAHDLKIVQYISDRVAVMYMGKLVEIAPSKQLYENPLHPYTRGLISSILDPTETSKKRPERILLGEPPSSIHPPTGCSFHPRCSEKMGHCSREVPKMTHFNDHHLVLCHLYT
ncbi:MAG: oligopeptide/dipeptide ABC transporter ATP-binding protein [Thermodesulfobacteriota bacterium]|nr:oligopeptide/dipeptide ABC transporter ATP-binding protein [Thermodesulfobacteriota bacterium]